MSQYGAWTDEAVAELRRLRSEGYSANQIANALHRTAGSVKGAFLRYRIERPIGEAKPSVVQIVMRALVKAALAGDQMPSNVELGRLAGCSDKTARHALFVLERTGRIETRRRSNIRAARIIDTGIKTALFDQLNTAVARAARRIEIAPVLPTPVLRDPCPYCAARFDADPVFCCARGRALRKLVA